MEMLYPLIQVIVLGGGETEEHKFWTGFGYFTRPMYLSPSMYLNYHKDRFKSRLAVSWAEWTMNAISQWKRRSV